MRAEAKEAAAELLADDDVASTGGPASPAGRGAKVVAFGDSLTSEPQSWAVILSELCWRRAPCGRRDLPVAISAVGGETTMHGLVRVGEVVGQQPS